MATGNEVATMKKKLTFEQAIKICMAKMDPGPCPKFKTLKAYRDDDLSPQDVESLQNHLSLCNSCARFYLDVVITRIMG